MIKSIILLFVILFYYIYLCFKNHIKLNIISLFTVLRGILSQNKFWWQLNDILLSDYNGNKLYLEYKENNKDFVPILLFGKDMYLVYKLENIKTIFDNSPFLFGVGHLKKIFFETFMKDNVGVSEGDKWIKRRKMNESVLDTDKIHRLSFYYNQLIYQEINDHDKLANLDDFSNIAGNIAFKIVYNTKPYKPIFEVFDKANSIWTFINDYQIPKNLMDKYIHYNIYNIRNPKPNSLVELGIKYETDEYELYNQLPHWLFPINGAISIAVPRLLTIILNDKNILNKIKNEIKEIDTNNPMQIYSMTYLRNCILELFRMMNPVNSSFRTLLKDLIIDNKQFKKDDQFIIFNNPIMRDPEHFINPNSFNPDRWTSELEKQYYALSFNQGKQKCPGKSLVIYLFKCFIIHFLTKLENDKINIESSMKIDINNVPQTINPFKIGFKFTTYN